GNLIGGYGLHLETGADVARVLASSELDGLPADWAVKYPALLEAVTLADAARVAAKHLMPHALVIVGRAEEIKPLLAKAGLTANEVVEFSEPVSAAERKLTDAKPI